MDLHNVTFVEGGQMTQQDPSPLIGSCRSGSFAPHLVRVRRLDFGFAAEHFFF